MQGGVLQKVIEGRPATGLGVALMMLNGCASTPPGHPLAEEINDYREARGLPAIPWSPALAKVAEVHLADIEAHDPTARECSLHSWSDKGPWTSCCYRADDPASAQCMRDKPRELIDDAYPHSGFEIVAWRSEAMSEATALAIWRRSPAHDAVLANEGVWASRDWQALGAALSDEHAVVWFGQEPDPMSD
ncbi:CAP domain-containing protein [Thioalkalivibrio sp.]|uniref:CAP domain-containing protein n=1 Tax=Thioalkalivibrio sp. TaxID=2093813 RepID=UPI00356A3AF2